MNKYTDKKCSITDECLSLIRTLRNQPIFMGTTDNHPSSDRFLDQNWMISKSGIVQLGDRVDLNELYKDGHNSGLIGSVWKQHHYEFSQFVCDYNFNTVLEIGGGHGILNANVRQALIKSDLDWTIIEPINATDYQSDIVKVNSIFDCNTKLNQKYDAIFHSHLFEHLYEPLDTLRNIFDHLTDTGVMCFSVPNMESMLASGIVSSINFEHTIYLPESLIEELLKASGFSIVKKKYFKDNHSIFFSSTKIKVKNKFGYRNYDKNKSDVLKFFELKDQEIANLNNILQNIEGNVWIFGAHIFSQYLLCNGLNTKRIVGILDNDPQKQGQRLYGTSIGVFSPEVTENSFGSVILRAGAYDCEIKEQLKLINKNTIII